MSDGTFNRHVFQFESRRDAPKHQPAPAHVTAADEVVWKDELPAEDRQQQIDVLAGRHAPEQHHLTLGPDCMLDSARGTFERLPVAGVAEVDSRIGEVPKRFDGHARVGGAKTRIRRDHEHPPRRKRVFGVWRACKALRVGQLPSKVQSAHEAEDIAELRSLATMKLARKRKPGFGRQHQLSATSRAVRR